MVSVTTALYTGIKGILVKKKKNFFGSVNIQKSNPLSPTCHYYTIGIPVRTERFITLLKCCTASRNRTKNVSSCCVCVCLCFSSISKRRHDPEVSAGVCCVYGPVLEVSLFFSSSTFNAFIQ